MYPLEYFNLFPPFPRDHRVFVAMSFAPEFDARWENVIMPAVKAIELDGSRLEPYRVDMRQVSDSVLTDILGGIARCRFFVADITTIGRIDGRPVRNANVMYEVGLAHAARLPEEVLLLRSDNDELAFDVRNVRVLRYEPDNAPAGARLMMKRAMFDSFKEIDQRRLLAVRRALDALDVECWLVLIDAMGDDFVSHPQLDTFGQALGGMGRARSLTRLLDMGLLRARLERLTPDVLDRKARELFAYTLTPFGHATVRLGLTQAGYFSPELQEHLRRIEASQEKPESEGGEGVRSES